MAFDVRFLVAYISALTTLEPFDLILTGSPKMCGEKSDPRMPLKAGDKIEVAVEGIGVLTNFVVEEEKASD
jgi:2-keto-4-pentenoate hydratase/2-oxohepta-3-ene-1,7-dioic acid hydratase in catechol pathway